MRVLWLISGHFALALGGLGIVLPLLPTVPLFLLAAFCFGKSSPRLHDWLVNHPTYGPHIANWRLRGAIAPRAKRLAVLSIALAFVISVVSGVAGWVLTVQAVVLTCVLGFILSRPDG